MKSSSWNRPTLVQKTEVCVTFLITALLCFPAGEQALCKWRLTSPRHKSPYLGGRVLLVTAMMSAGQRRWTLLTRLGVVSQQTRQFLYFSHQWGPLSRDSAPIFRLGLWTLWPAAHAAQGSGWNGLQPLRLVWKENRAGELRQEYWKMLHNFC